MQTSYQHYHLSKLLGYDYIISYKLGKSNKAANALSRRAESNQAQYFILLVPPFQFSPTLLSENKSFSNLQELHKEVHQADDKHPTLQIINEIIYHKRKPV